VDEEPEELGGGGGGRGGVVGSEDARELACYFSRRVHGESEFRSDRSFLSIAFCQQTLQSGAEWPVSER
jgi:hypothetical protein